MTGAPRARSGHSQHSSLARRRQQAALTDRSLKRTHTRSETHEAGESGKPQDEIGISTCAILPTVFEHKPAAFQQQSLGGLTTESLSFEIMERDMSIDPSITQSPAGTTTRAGDHDRHRTAAVRKSTESKASFKTTEFIAYPGCVAAIAIMRMVVGDDSNANGGGDYLLADDAMLLITIVTVGYLLSRGLATSGSRDCYDDTIDLDTHRR